MTIKTLHLLEFLGPGIQKQNITKPEKHIIVQPINTWSLK